MLNLIMSYILTAVLGLPLTLALYNAYCLLLNYQIACKIGITVIVLLSSPDNPLWMLTGKYVLSIVKAIFGECSLTRYGRLGREYYEKSSPHLELGDAMVLVTPAHNWIFICNTDAFNEIFQSRNDFPRPPEMLGMLNCTVSMASEL